MLIPQDFYVYCICIPFDNAICSVRWISLMIGGKGWSLQYCAILYDPIFQTIILLLIHKIMVNYN